MRDKHKVLEACELLTEKMKELEEALNHLGKMLEELSEWGGTE